jgi:hypothetical protein
LKGIIQEHRVETLSYSDVITNNSLYFKRMNKKVEQRSDNKILIKKEKKKIDFKQNNCNLNSYKCPECPYRGRDNDNIKIHLKNHNNKSKDKIKCDKCSYYCKINNMAKHKIVHSKDYVDNLTKK